MGIQRRDNVAVQCSCCLLCISTSCLAHC